MQREIKFRFFRKLPTPKMIYPKKDFYIGADTGNVYLDIQYSETRQSVKQLDLIPMQFTGLKDKNGVEIYEGDIVNYDVAITGNNESFKRTAIVTWFPQTASFRFLCPIKSIYREILSASSTQVIGNIYENPDLIKDVADKITLKD